MNTYDPLFITFLAVLARKNDYSFLQGPRGPIGMQGGPHGPRPGGPMGGGGPGPNRGRPAPAAEEPPVKKMKTEDSLIPENEFLANNTSPVSFKVYFAFLQTNRFLPGFT